MRQLGLEILLTLLGSAASSPVTAQSAPTVTPAPVDAGQVRAGLARARQALETGKVRLAVAESRQLKSMLGTDPAGLAIDFTIALWERRFDRAVDLLERMARTPSRFGTAVDLLEVADVRLLTYVTEGHAAQRLAALIDEIGWEAEPGKQTGNAAKRTRIEQALARKDMAVATAHMRTLPDPFLLADFLILDKFADFAPAVIAEWGADLRRADEQRGAVLAEAATLPGASSATFAAWLEWLHAHDRDKEAWPRLAARVAMLPSSTEPVADKLTLLDIVARSLARHGKGEDALALLRDSRGLVERDTVGRIGILTTEAALAGNLGLHERALTAAREAAGQKDVFDFVLAIALRDQSCALIDLGRPTEARNALVAIDRLEGAELAPFQIEAHFCAADQDGATRRAERVLRDRTGLLVLRRLQRRPDGTWGAWTRRWREGYVALAAQPRVIAALRGYGTIRELALRESSFD